MRARALGPELKGQSPVVATAVAVADAVGAAAVVDLLDAIGGTMSSGNPWLLPMQG